MFVYNRVHQLRTGIKEGSKNYTSVKQKLGFFKQGSMLFLTFLKKTHLLDKKAELDLRWAKKCLPPKPISRKAIILFCELNLVSKAYTKR